MQRFRTKMALPLERLSVATGLTSYELESRQGEMTFFRCNCEGTPLLSRDSRPEHLGLRPEVERLAGPPVVPE